MNHKKITTVFDLISKICAVMIAAAIVLSTAATNILFIATPIFSLFAGDLRAKFKTIIRNPVAIIFLLFYALFVIGAFYSTASWSNILLALKKYDKFLLAIFFLPLFAEKRWRDYAINAFLAAILVMLIASYLLELGWLTYGAKNGIAIFKNSIELSFLMAFATYFCLIKIWADVRYRWLWILFLLSIAHTILFRNIGRTGYIVLISLLILFFFQKMGWRGLLIAAITSITLFGLAFTFSPMFKTRTYAAIDDIKIYHKTDNTSVGLRISFAKNSLRLIKKNLFLGTGTGSFVDTYATIKHIPAGNPHNEYLNITIQFGILGLIVLLLVFGIPLWYSRFLPEEPKYIVRAVVLGIMVGSFANSWLLDTTEGHFYVYFIVLAFAAIPIKKQFKKLTWITQKIFLHLLFGCFLP
jgi:O-antigen ligase